MEAEVESFTNKTQAQINTGRPASGDKLTSSHILQSGPGPRLPPGSSL